MKTLVTFLLLVAAAAAQDVPVPAAYKETWTELDSKLTALEKKTDEQWNGRRPEVDFAAEVLTANGNRGRQLLQPQTQAALKLELDRLQKLGISAVTVAIPFPLLYRPFLEWNGDPDDFQPFVDFYTKLADDAHNRGLKVYVESSVLFPGAYSAGSGLKVAEYYKKLPDREYNAGRATVINTIARNIHPDAIQMGSEPDTEATVTGKASLKSPQAHARLITDIVMAVRSVGGAGVPLGAGVGSWMPDATAYVRTLVEAIPEIDFIDVHVYPINGEALDNLIAITDLCKTLHKPVTVLEAWETKTKQSETGSMNAAADSTVFSRDAFSFWAPMDQRFIRTMMKLAYWKRLKAVSFFWSMYFSSYVDYEKVKDLPPEEIRAAAQRAAADAMLKGQYSPTGELYRDYIADVKPLR